MSATTPPGRPDEHERFARAVDALPPHDALPESQVPREKPYQRGRSAQTSMTDSLDAHRDADMAEELAIVAMLRSTAKVVGPDPAARQRMRQRVLAGLTGPQSGAATRKKVPRETVPSGPARAVRGSGTGKHRRPARRSSTRARLAVTAATALCLVLSLAGMGLILSGSAMPGDTLYTVKRSAETAALGLALNNESKALKHLDFATARLNEITKLSSRQQDGGAGAAQGYLTALAGFDPDAMAASRLLTQLGTKRDSGLLTKLVGWTQAQSQQLTSTLPDLPSQAASRVATTLDLLTRIHERAVALLARTDCTTVTSGTSDAIGALPAANPCVPVAVGRKTTPGPLPSRPPESGQPIVPSPQQSTPAAPPPHSTGTSQQPTAPVPLVKIPLLPHPTPPSPTRPAPITLPPTLVIPLPLPTIEGQLGGLLRIRLGY